MFSHEALYNKWINITSLTSFLIMLLQVHKNIMKTESKYLLEKNLKKK